MLQIKSVGHTGTLDPFATGLLVLLTGRATRLARFIEQQSKTYLATARLGFATTTDDVTGEPLTDPVDVSHLTRELVLDRLTNMMGPQSQVPSAFSAKKVGGERSYRRARRGESVTLAPTNILIHAIELLEYESGSVTFRTTVSPGTYVRAMARDLGEVLGTGGHLTALRREAIGTLSVSDALPLEELTTDTPLASLRQVLSHVPPVELNDEERAAIGHGRPVSGRISTGAAHVLLVQGDDVLAVAKEDGEWLRPVVVLEGT